MIEDWVTLKGLWAFYPHVKGFDDPLLLAEIIGHLDEDRVLIRCFVGKQTPFFQVVTISGMGSLFSTEAHARAAAEDFLRREREEVIDG